MKVAFHFNAGFPGLGNDYGRAVEAIVFGKILNERQFRVASKVYIGDLPLHILCPDAEKLEKALKLWRIQALNGWRRFTQRIKTLAEIDTFVICFETIGQESAAKLHHLLRPEECYLGAIEVQDAARIHWELYSDSLALRYRIGDPVLTVLYDETSSDEPSQDEIEEETDRFLDGIGTPASEPVVIADYATTSTQALHATI